MSQCIIHWCSKERYQNDKQATSNKQQATSNKQQATSNKQQATYKFSPKFLERIVDQGQHSFHVFKRYFSIGVFAVLVVSTVQCGGASADATTPSGGGSGQFDPICTNGVESTEKVSTANTEKCVSCNTGFEKNGELCGGFNFICPKGVPLTGKAPGKNMVMCTSCDSYYALKNIDKTCAEVQVITLAGGNKGGGMPCTPSSSSCMDGIGTAAQFNNPAGIAVDSSDNIIYVVDRQNHRIRKITLASGIGTVSSFAGTGTSGSMNDMTGMPGSARFWQPEGLAVDSSGIVYVAGTISSLIRKITPPPSATGMGTVTTFAGGGNPAEFVNPNGVAVDSLGIVYVADTGNNRIRKITLDYSATGMVTVTVTTFAGGNKGGGIACTPPSSNCMDGMGTSAQFNIPVSVAVDGSGNVYVADRGNHRIRKITPGRVVTTFAGGGNPAEFDAPNGVAVDSKGFVYVADTGNHRIRKITPDGVVTTLAGGRNPVQFHLPEDVAVDKLGNVYVADTQNDRIRKIAIPQ